MPNVFTFKMAYHKKCAHNNILPNRWHCLWQCLIRNYHFSSPADGPNSASPGQLRQCTAEPRSWTQLQLWSQRSSSVPFGNYSIYFFNGHFFFISQFCGFEPRSSCVRSDCSTHCAYSYALWKQFLFGWTGSGKHHGVVGSNPAFIKIKPH